MSRCRAFSKTKTRDHIDIDRSKESDLVLTHFFAVCWCAFCHNLLALLIRYHFPRYTHHTPTCSLVSHRASTVQYHPPTIRLDRMEPSLLILLLHLGSGFSYMPHLSSCQGREPSLHNFAFVFASCIHKISFQDLEESGSRSGRHPRSELKMLSHQQAAKHGNI